MNLSAIRHELHRHPENSGKEADTARKIIRHLLLTQPDALYRDLGGHGVAACYKGHKPGPKVLIRCDMDALPIPENLPLAYRSQNMGISHKCGHDGHMAIMLGVSSEFGRRAPETGEVILLFQPAEETGEGAMSVLNDPRFEQIKPDWVFAMHNLPGFPLGQLVIRDGCFALASRGFMIHLEGKTSHAAEPEKGNSPVIAVAQLLQQFTELSEKVGSQFGEFLKSTVIYARLGEIAFGTTPGLADVMVTLRTQNNSDMDQLVEYSETIAAQCARKNGLKCKMEWTESFPACLNQPAANQFLRETALRENIPFLEKDKPFGWSEDFGHFLAQTQGAIFGIGSGVDCPALHHPDYDFPDEMIASAVQTWIKLVQRITG